MVALVISVPSICFFVPNILRIGKPNQRRNLKINAGNKKQQGARGGHIGTEEIKEGGEQLLEAIKTVFNECIIKGITPTAWDKAIIVILYKRGDTPDLKIYRSISLLSHLYKPN